MPDDENDELAQDLAAELGPDVVYLQPPGETHFVGEAALIALGTALLTAYAGGFLKAAKGEAEGLGEQTARWFARRVKAIFGSSDDEQVDAADAEQSDGDDPPAEADSAEDVGVGDVRVVLTTVTETTTVEVWAGTAESTVATALREAGLPEDRARQLAATTRARVMEAAAS